MLALLLAADILLADFEGPGYGDWAATGAAFGLGPARGTLPNQMVVTGYQGKGLVNSFRGGDSSTGTLTSPEFVIQRRTLRFLIGGGKDAERTAMHLLVDGRVVRRATGPNDRPGGSEALRPDGWDVREFLGRKARLRIVDEATGGWGHINIDQIVMTNTPLPTLMRNVTKKLTPNKRFMLVPIKNGAPKRWMTLDLGDGHPSRNEVELADGPPDWYAAIDVSNRQGAPMTVTVDELSSDSQAMRNIRLSDSVPRSDESLRGRFHFSARRGWLNDPNGLCFFWGEYHLFFQHNPYGWGWGNMSWGHAVSKDLLNWTELPIALFPEGSDGMFSGSAVVDWKNTSGLGKPGQPAMVLFYTRAGKEFTQNIAYTLDGRTFHKYAANPVVGQITHGNRDPKVIWHEPAQKWVMVLYVERAGVHTIEFLESRDLLRWKSMSHIDGFFECPDLFELPVSGSDQKKWILTAADSDYMVGDFDGTRFVPETPKLKGHQGAGFYAAQTFSDEPKGRRIQIGWFQTETPGMPFNQSMSVPMELTLVGNELRRQPVAARSQAHRDGELGVGELRTLDWKVPGRYGLAQNARRLRLTIGPIQITTGDDGEIRWPGQVRPLPRYRGFGVPMIQLVLDKNGAEIFVNDMYYPIPIPLGPNPKIEIENLENVKATLDTWR